MKKKYSFPEPKCRYDCEHFVMQGGAFCETKYCMAKSKNGRRFSKSDSQQKPPKWCPKRKPPVCRIYGFADDRGEFMEDMRRREFDVDKMTTSGYRKGITN